jgi:hypothetical protein
MQYLVVRKHHQWSWANHPGRWRLRRPRKPCGVLRTTLELLVVYILLFPMWYHCLLLPLHPSNLCLTQVLLEARVEVAPPLEEHRLADQLEPRCELERLVLEHGLQLVLGHEGAVAGLVGVDV